ncbi:neuropilin-2b [Hypomesus transpacificus]|uniref:neuropilin-2b n=1 Tax=Hypomesus transpacificus TaxID=137520 RepID=UPI001F07A8D4|nr:neuropilin-2b [Hypomesus transpacificus]
MDVLIWLCGCLFALCYPVVNGEEGEPCGGHLDASDAGYITSPGYPLEYPPHQNCRWIITAPEPSQRIVLNFNPHFELEKLECRYDFIEIRDGNSENADLLLKHCNNIAPAPIISSGPVLYIKFVSDYAHQLAGFSLRYEIYKTASSPPVPLQVFHANTDPTEVVLNRIPQPVLARFVRIRPQTWKNGIALRFELYGCQITDAPCSELQGMMSGLLPESQISASSMRDIHGSMGAARLVASRSGWFPSPTQPLAGEEWLQVDLAVPRTVSGIITQGARSVEGSTSAENRAFVRKYKLAHSLTGKEWTFIQDIKTGHAKIFEGNIHYDTPEVRRFEELVAQFVRVYPERWSPAGIGMRMEVLGCELPESTTVPDTATPTLPRIEDTTAALRPAVTNPSSQGGLCDFEQSLCGWTTDPRSDLSWSVHTGSSSPGAGTSLDLALASDDVGNFLRMDASGRLERQRARLVSPEVGPEQGPLCLLFSYQLHGEAEGSLRVLLQDSDQEETLLWALRGDQGSLWKEGRTILPQSPKEYQVVIEGFFEHGGRGHISVDNIHMSSTTELEQCTQPFAAFPPDMTDQRPVDFGKDPFNEGRERVNGGFSFPEWSTPNPSLDPPVTRVSEKDNSWLYTLDPILVTIIVMSSLGVLLGAVCAGLLLYCTCSYSGLSSRSSTTLENYNFELYDGIKHKVKINQQRCCSEA